MDGLLLFCHADGLLPGHLQLLAVPVHPKRKERADRVDDHGGGAGCAAVRVQGRDAAHLPARYSWSGNERYGRNACDLWWRVGAVAICEGMDDIGRRDRE